jgi:hypothetical protein
MVQMMTILKPQDILVMLKLVALGQQPWSYAWLAVSLGMSPSQLHSAVQRALVAQLAVKKGDIITPHIRNLEEFLVHGLRYVFVADLGRPTRGIPTAYAAPPLDQHFAESTELPPVWPDPEGTARGVAFSPLYKLAPQAARSDHALYELLALVDAIRGGRARERDLAIKELKNRLAQYA